MFAVVAPQAYPIDLTTLVLRRIALDENHNWAYTGGTDERICVWDLNSLQRRATFTASGGVVKLVMIPERQLVAATTTVGCIDVFDPRVENQLMRLSGHQGIVLDAAVEGDVLVSGGDDSTVKIFDLRKLVK